MKYAFIIEWKDGSINDNIVKYLRENKIDYHRNHYFQLVADIYNNGNYYSFDYEKINGDLYGITLENAIA